MPFGFGKKDDRRSFITDITDNEDLKEIEKIAEMLNPNEKVFVVARQSRLKPGGSKFTPNIVFATDRRIIIKDPSMLGMHENVVDIPFDMITSVKLDKGVFSSSVIFTAPGLTNSGRRGKLDKIMMAGSNDIDSGVQREAGIITAIPKVKAEDLIELIRNGMDRNREVSSQQQHSSDQPTSVADELTKLAKLKEQGVISDSEFQQMKQNLLDRM